MARPAPSLKYLVEIFQKSNLALSRDQYELFWRFDGLLRRRNQELDLTRIKSFESTVIKHYVDCALVPGLVELPSPLLDIGTGAGFPGIPIKIVRPEIEMILSEGRARRVSFLKEACALLGFKGVDVYPHKISGRFDMPVSGVITRALETAAGTLQRVKDFLPEGGKVILMKGPNCDREIADAKERFGQSFDLEKDLAYSIPDSPHKRRLLVFNRRSMSHIQGADPYFHALSGGAGDSSFYLAGTKVITSTNNESFKMLMALHGARGIKKYGLALISGGRHVREVLRDFPEQCEALLFSSGENMHYEADAQGIRHIELKPELFRQVDIHGTRSPILLVKVDPMHVWNETDPVEGCTLIVPFQDPANVGAAIRSAAAFGVSRVVILKEAAHPFLPKSARAAGSALMRVPLCQGPSITELSGSRSSLLLLSPEGRNISEFRFPSSFCLVAGLEGMGLPENLRKCDLVSIPMEAGIDSLNAAVATGIVLYLWRESLRNSLS
ncbi:MAG: 16S rRNA (guanine(527)-N(7))-methyltransferase RsmG [Desulfobacteraceae bacterium]|jgi:16S rRNA (guanine527-N7)-methyltransferase|nr:MAG: 16S rRNA (guanine(527)-N(7))-methyltransferase RsmG [Desulfobacteraceae bacterium]